MCEIMLIDLLVFKPSVNHLLMLHRRATILCIWTFVALIKVCQVSCYHCCGVDMTQPRKLDVYGRNLFVYSWTLVTVETNETHNRGNYHPARQRPGSLNPTSSALSHDAPRVCNV